MHTVLPLTRVTKVHQSHFQVEELYRAMRTFDDLMNSEENHIRLKMKPGDMVTVKNTRVMHGRSGFQTKI